MTGTTPIVMGVAIVSAIACAYVMVRIKQCWEKMVRTPLEPTIGDVKVILRGDGAFIIEEYVAGHYGVESWQVYHVIQADEYKPEERELTAVRAQEIAAARLDFNREQREIVRKLEQKTVIGYGKVK